MLKERITFERKEAVMLTVDFSGTVRGRTYAGVAEWQTRQI